MKMEPPYTEFKELWEKMMDWWDENGRTRERISEPIDRVGMGEFLRAIDVEPVAQMVKVPRANPYIFWKGGKTPPKLEEFKKWADKL